MLIVKVPFVGHGYNMPNVGEIINPGEALSTHLIDIGVAEVYETKIMPAPEEVKEKTKKQSGLSRQVRASTKKTAKRSKKTAKKS